MMKLGVKGLIISVYLLLGPSSALYLQWVCGGLDALVRQSSTENSFFSAEWSLPFRQ
jgi:hypothetical protein